MRRRDLAIPGESISELTLGTWGLCGDAYGSVTEVEQDQVIVRARALGITAFETADTYASGAMESRLGRLLGGDPEVKIITKVGTDRSSQPARKRFDLNWLRKSIEASSDRLKRSPIDLVLLHNPAASTLRQSELCIAMQNWASQGLFRSWGVSAGSAEVAEVALDAQAPAVQLAFNCFWDSDFKRIVERLREQKTWFLARSVLAHGLLCGFWPMDKTFPVDDHRSRRWTADDLRRRIHQLEALRPFVHEGVHSLRSLALRWVLNHAEVSTAVVGPRSAQQLDQLLREMGEGPPYLPADDLVSLEMRLMDFGARV